MCFYGVPYDKFIDTYTSITFFHKSRTSYAWNLTRGCLNKVCGMTTPAGISMQMKEIRNHTIQELLPASSELLFQDRSGLQAETGRQRWTQRVFLITVTRCAQDAVLLTAEWGCLRIAPEHTKLYCWPWVGRKHLSLGFMGRPEASFHGTRMA